MTEIPLDPIARDYLDRNGGNVDPATDEFLSDLRKGKHSEVRWGITRVGCEVLVRRVLSGDRTSQLAEMANGGGEEEIAMVGRVQSLSASGKVLRRAFGGQDPYDWPVPFLDKRIGDCTPEELEVSVHRIEMLIDTYTWERDYIQTVAGMGEEGRPIRETVHKDLLLAAAQR